MTTILRSLLISSLKFFFSDAEKRCFLEPWLHKEISVKSLGSMRGPNIKSRIHLYELICLQLSVQFLTEPATYF